MKNSSFIHWRSGLIIFAGISGLPVMMTLAAATGDMQISLAVTAKAITNGIGFTHYDLPAVEAGIVWQYRMSRALMAAASGGGLALCGLVLQSLLRNPLADPYLLGISAGASTGAVSVMLLGIGYGSLTTGTGAFVGACIAFMFITILTRGMREHSSRIIIAGIAGTQLFNALTSYIVSTAANAEQSRGVMFWLLGSLSGIRWSDALLCMVTVIMGFLIMMCYARSLDTFSFGNEVSVTLGTRVLKVRIVLLLTTALVTAVIVSAIGAVGFVGLVIPHITRMVAGHSHSFNIPITFLAGCHFMIIADLLSRTVISHQVLPIGVVTALAGAPVFAIILFCNRGK